MHRSFKTSLRINTTFCLALLGGASLGPAVLAQAGREEVRAKHILISSQEEAATIREEIMTNGGDQKAFNAAVRKYSKDPTTKVLNGDVGYFGNRGSMDARFSDAAFALKVGDISEPVESPFGWHLIYVVDRRSKDGAVAPIQPPTPTPAPSGAEGTEAGAATTADPHAGHDHGDTPAGAAAAGATTTTDATTTDATATDVADVTPPATPAPAVEARRSVRGEQGFVVTLETAKATRGFPRNSFTPAEAIEVNISLKNQGSKDQKFFVASLLPLGLRVTSLGDFRPLAGDFSSLPEPETFLRDLKAYELIGMEVSINDFWKDVQGQRLGINWDLPTFFTNLEARFPKVKELPEYAPLAEALRTRFPVTKDVVQREATPRVMYQRSRDLAVTVLEDLDPTKKYYAEIKLSGDTTPIVIALSGQQFAAAKHFAMLVTDGFYDGLDFFDFEKGDYFLGGCPTRTGTGAPAMTLPLLRNDAKIQHQRGTVTFVSRNIRAKGPVRGGEVGSIFAVCLKPHPEWDDQHVPFGEVISGLDILDKKTQAGGLVFQKIAILTEEQYKRETGGATDAASSATIAVGNPEAVIKTSKGDVTVELFEDTARNTVANFVSLASSGFFAKDSAGTGKQKFSLMKDADGKPLLIQTGSPTADGAGGPGYSIPNEVNAKPHVKGALVMVLAYDEAAGKYVPDSAGSQFFICLQNIPYYDFQKQFTVFGQVRGGLDVLDSLADGDSLESVEITKKKSHAYNVRKVSGS